MYQQQPQHSGDEILTPHESIITEEAPGGDFAITYHDMSAFANPTAYPELDFHLQHDVTGSNYFTYHADDSTRLGAPPTADMLYQQQDFSYQHLQQQLPSLHMMRDVYGSLPSESSGFVPGMVEGYTNNNNNYMNMNINMSSSVPGQFESSRVGAGGRRQRGGGGASGMKGIEKKEKQRRERLGAKYEMLKALIPNRTKDDRATIVSDAIDYINELCRTVNELKLLVEKKRLKSCSAGSFCTVVGLNGNNNNNKMVVIDSTTESSEVLLLPPDTHENHIHTINHQREKDIRELEGTAVTVPVPVAMNSHDKVGPRLRSSWLQRRSKEALVDVRIIEDEVNIKITKKKKAIGCLLPVARAIDDLHLHLLNLAGAIIGECHVYMFNTQIMEGSSVYASAVAKKLIEVIDMY